MTLEAELSQRFEDILGIITPGMADVKMGIEETPGRAARMWLNELTSGYGADIESLFRLFEPEDYEGIVLVRDIPVRSTCVHHLVPFIGYANVGYVPGDYVLGLSKVARVIDAFSRRLQIQENLTQEIISAFSTYLKPKGAIVMIEAEHMCMTMRGVQAPGTKTMTSDVCGCFTDEAYKNEFFTMLRSGR